MGCLRKFWARSAEFQNLSGEEAFAKKKQLQGLEDRSYAGHGSDTIWSNNNDGSGKNWLGLQLMLLRDQLTGSRTWTSWIQQHVNLETGEVFDEAWQQLVMTATRTVLRELGEVRNTAGSAGYSGLGWAKLENFESACYLPLQTGANPEC
eukprot:Skav232116  [mRNA]  locus=scaffold2353:133052:142220:+ [translate_table: standard]